MIHLTEIDDRTLLATGIIGLLVSAVGSFVPTIMALFGVVSVLTWLDFVLLPLFLAFATLTGYSVWRLRQGQEHAS